MQTNKINKVNTFVARPLLHIWSTFPLVLFPVSISSTFQMLPGLLLAGLMIAVLMLAHLLLAGLLLAGLMVADLTGSPQTVLR